MIGEGFEFEKIESDKPFTESTAINTKLPTS